VKGDNENADNYLQITNHMLGNGIPIQKTPFYLHHYERKVNNEKEEG
jgi:hypothetical protein